MLPNNQFHYLHRAHNAIANVLTGRTADGTEAIPCKVSFTDDAAARNAAAHQLRLIICHCQWVLDLEDVTPLTVKFLWHLTRTGTRTADAIHVFPVIPVIHAIRHAPFMVRGKGSLFSILRRHHQHKARERALQWHRLNDSVPERKVLWSDGLFTLEEATDPRHLIQDTLTLGHCVGTLYNRAALAHVNINEEHPKAIKYLHYWLKIKKGECRIVTLIEEDTPRLTIDFHPASNTIVSAQGMTTQYGEILPLPPEVKAPLYAAIKVLPVREERVC